MKNELAGIIAAIEDMKKLLSQNNKVETIDTQKIEDISTQMVKIKLITSQQITKLDKAIEEARKPIIKENHHIVDIPSKGTVSLLTVLLVAVVTLTSALYFTSRPNYAQRDNDLKYRYIKMKGEASPSTISNLETLFELNRDNTKIKEMHQTVKTYEKTIQKQAILNEQAHLKQLEAERLDNEAKKLKDR